MEETSTQRAARLRREKREKRILDGGSSRLDSIASLSGRPAPEPEDAQSAEAPPRAGSGGGTAADSPVLSSRLPSGDTTEEVPAAISGLPRGQGPNNGLPTLGGFPNGAQGIWKQPPGSNGEEADTQAPLQQLLQQMMGAPGAGSGPGAEGVPPGLEGLLSSMAPAGQQSTATPQQRKRASLWRVLHPLVALALGLYICVAYGFDGAFQQRMAGQPGNKPVQVFWLFATVELGLQSVRYALERGQEQAGMLGTVAGMLPEPWKGRLQLIARYRGIWTTLVGDALVVIWVLGAGAWWQGGLR